MKQMMDEELRDLIRATQGRLADGGLTAHATAAAISATMATLAVLEVDEERFPEVVRRVADVVVEDFHVGQRRARNRHETACRSLIQPDSARNGS